MKIMLTNSKKWKNIKEITSVLQAIAVIFGLAFAIWQISIVQKQVEVQSKALSESNKIASANYVLTLSKRLDAPQYAKIMNAISYNDRNYPILKESGGQFRSEEVDTLLGLYETIGNLYRDNLISKEMAYNEFSEDFKNTWCNKSIQTHIRDIRQLKCIYNDTKIYFFEFETLAKEFLAIEKIACEDLD